MGDGKITKAELCDSLVAQIEGGNNMSILRSAILQNASSVISTGTPITIADANTLNLSVAGTSTSFTINFEASLDGTNWGKIAGTKLLDSMTMASSTSTTGELWEFDVPALTQFRANLISIANGNITVNASSST